TSGDELKRRNGETAMAAGHVNGGASATVISPLPKLPRWSDRTIGENAMVAEMALRQPLCGWRSVV
ncbi:hypothetical protein, partial [Sphingomonas sp. CROZ-RG-20F-R02-07]|uniref:hypothetical protein n=1 Tax=Sphingomonas sp. CROZ-RG-20F-R02-07 TaxID=2914832 RepID=UPI001F595ABF